MGTSIKAVKVLVLDGDKYFIEGLRHVVSDFYLGKGMVVKFIEWPVTQISVDIIFLSIGYGVVSGIFKKLNPGMPLPKIFLIRDSKGTRLSHIFKSVRKNGALYRNQPIDVVNSMLEEALFLQRAPASNVTLDGVIRILTLREREVLQCLEQGKSLFEVAVIMKIMNKTVSSHKRSAMRKLNLKRNQELYYWLLQGGLSCAERER